MSDAPSQRPLDQRLRNRMAEAVDLFADWENVLPFLGAVGSFNFFFDVFPDQPPLPPNTALTEPERAALTRVLVMVEEACSATLPDVTEDQLIASGWPQRIAPEARAALALMRVRGRFSGDAEEAEPSDRFTDL